jgi:hypothetical protein
MNARKLLAIAGFVTLTLAGAGAVQAQEEVAGDLVLLKTTIKTSNGGIFNYIPGTHVELLSPTTVTCPVPSCTLRVEVSTQFKGKTPGTPSSFGVASIEIDGTADGILPIPYGVFADGVTNAWSSQAFAVMKDVSNGDHTVTVWFAAIPAKVVLNGVTLTVQVFKPTGR